MLVSLWSRKYAERTQTQQFQQLGALALKIEVIVCHVGELQLEETFLGCPQIQQKDIDGNGYECGLGSGTNPVLLEEHCLGFDNETLQLQYESYGVSQVCEHARLGGAANTIHGANLF